MSIVISQIRGEWGLKSFTCERRLGDTKNPTPWCFELGRPDIRISHPFLTKVCEDSTFVSCAHSKEILWLKQKRRMLSYLVISLSPSTFQDMRRRCVEVGRGIVSDLLMDREWLIGWIVDRLLACLIFLLQLRALVTSVCAGRCQQYYWADAMGSHHGHITHVLTSRKGHGVSKVSRQVLRELCKTPHLQGNSRRITALQNQPFPNYTLDFRSTCSRHTSSASQRTTTSHSPCTLSQAPTHDRNEMYFSHEDLRQNKPFPM